MGFEAILLAFINSAALGFLVAAPVGPVGALCISRTLGAGTCVGLATGFGAATAHAVWTLTAALAAANLASLGQNSAIARSACVASAVLLTYMGARAFVRRRVLAAAIMPAPTALVSLSAYLSGIALAAANPATALVFVTSVPAVLPANAQPAPNGLLLAAGTFAGSSFWWVILCTSMMSLRGRITMSMLSMLNKAAGLLLIGFAAILVSKAF